MKSTTQARRCYSVKEVGDMYGVSKTLVYELINDGVIETIKFGRRRLIPVAALPRLEKRLAVK